MLLHSKEVVDQIQSWGFSLRSERGMITRLKLQLENQQTPAFCLWSLHQDVKVILCAWPMQRHTHTHTHLLAFYKRFCIGTLPNYKLMQSDFLVENKVGGAVLRLVFVQKEKVRTQLGKLQSQTAMDIILRLNYGNLQSAGGAVSFGHHLA